MGNDILYTKKILSLYGSFSSEGGIGWTCESNEEFRCAYRILV